MTNFSDLGLGGPILKAVAATGYDTPTPIQEQVIPVMLDGRDVVGIAQTGTGKTAAFVLPILNHILNDNSRPSPGCCKALIVAPTRELAAQIVESVRTYAKNMKHSVTLVVGGASARSQIMQLKRGVDIVVATPGRLLDHNGTGAIDLSETTTVVLDEADQMMDMGFIPAIREIMAAVSHERQTLLLSATMPNQIRRLANDFLSDPAEISVAAVATPVERIEQRVFAIAKSDKQKRLVEILKGEGMNRAIVFTRTKRGADKVNFSLLKAKLNSVAIHGDKTQGQREKALRSFKTGRVNILVATDIAARGIDVDGVSHVINYDLPNVPEAYVHRIGRTARAGESGIAISFADDTQRAELRDIERLIGYAFDTMGEGGMIKLPPRMAAPKSRNRKGKRGGSDNQPKQVNYAKGKHKPGGGFSKKKAAKTGINSREEFETSEFRFKGPKVGTDDMSKGVTNNPARVDRSEERRDFKKDRPKFNKSRPESGERPKRTERNDRPDFKKSRPERSERKEHGERKQHGERNDRQQRSERPNRDGGERRSKPSGNSGARPTRPAKGGKASASAGRKFGGVGKPSGKQRGKPSKPSASQRKSNSKFFGQRQKAKAAKGGGGNR